jgi:hypothetical protein
MAQVLAKLNLLVKSLWDFIENSIGLLIYNMESSFELCRCQPLSLMNGWVKIIYLCGCGVGSKGFWKCLASLKGMQLGHLHTVKLRVGSILKKGALYEAIAISNHVVWWRLWLVDIAKTLPTVKPEVNLFISLNICTSQDGRSGRIKYMPTI